MVRLTPAGRQMLDEIETVREQFLRRVLDRLDPTQLTGVAKAMADLRDAVAATRDRGGRPPPRPRTPREELRTYGSIPH